MFLYCYQLNRRRKHFFLRKTASRTTYISIIVFSAENGLLHENVYDQFTSMISLHLSHHIFLHENAKILYNLMFNLLKLLNLNQRKRARDIHVQKDVKDSNIFESCSFFLFRRITQDLNWIIKLYIYKRNQYI